MKGKYSIDLPYGTHTLDVATMFPILLSLDGSPIQAINAGSGTLTLRKCQGTLSVDPSEPKTPYKFEVTSKPSQPGEHMRSLEEEPVPQPAPASNFLAQIRQKVRQDMGITREAFADHQSLYEIPDNEMFEEEIIEDHKKRREDVQNQPVAETESEGTSHSAEISEEPESSSSS